VSFVVVVVVKKKLKQQNKMQRGIKNKIAQFVSFVRTKADVDSSKIKNVGFFKIMRAIATRCFSPGFLWLVKKTLKSTEHKHRIQAEQN
jgi:hypothetical protein